MPECERTKHVHRLHPYLGKYIRQLVEIFLRRFKPRVVVYDPFCGSGTTLVEANARRELFLNGSSSLRAWLVVGSASNWKTAFANGNIWDYVQVDFSVSSGMC